MQNQLDDRRLVEYLDGWLLMGLDVNAVAVAGWLGCLCGRLLLSGDDFFFTSTYMFVGSWCRHCDGMVAGGGVGS